jgi:2-polyprenyl-6-hydroxyphenyl methylase/3-demethylubiquinone-9 3-methyltransferase
MLSSQSIDPEEQKRFDALAETWWNPQGPMRVLHRINPVRLKFICDALKAHFGTPSSGDFAFDTLSILDSGCGGGLVCEPLARLGTDVTGVDMAEDLIAVAKQHAEQAGLPITYRHASLESLAAAGEIFDVVLALEVVEHVTDIPSFIKTLGALVRPNGIIILSTFNRTMMSFLAGIVIAEYVLGWLPRNTHQWNKFVTPEELGRTLQDAGLAVRSQTGLCYRPLSCEWVLDPADLAVNYFMTAHKPA